MEKINGKIWLSNIDKSITNVSQLNPKTFKSIYFLIENGAKIEIGEGNPSKFGKGLYCTNKTIKELTDLYSKFYKEKDLNVESNEKQTESVDDIFKALCKLGKDYSRGMYQGSMGLNVGDVLDSIAKKYDEKYVPLIKKLSNEDKNKLLNKIEIELKESYDTAKNDYLYSAMDLLKPRKKVVRKKKPVINENIEKMTVEEIMTILNKMNKSYYLAVDHGLYGLNTDDIIDGVLVTYRDKIKPAIKILSREDKELLLEMLNEKIEQIPENNSFYRGAKKVIINDFKKKNIEETTNEAEYQIKSK